MRFSDLANYCESIDIDCNKCNKKEECERFTAELDEASPVLIRNLVKEDKEL